jgi:hypothetical protein
MTLSSMVLVWNVCIRAFHHKLRFLRISLARDSESTQGVARSNFRE